jgi:phosphate transport system permease protein
MSAPPIAFEPRLALRRGLGRVFAGLCLLTCLSALAALAVLMVQIVSEGGRYVTRAFLTHFPSTLDPDSAGIKGALWGTAWLIAMTAALCVPLGLGAAIYLEEYAPRNRWTRLIHLNIANLAGVPSIVYGMLGLAIFVRSWRLDRSLLSGALTLTLLVLPVLIIAGREAIAAVPRGLREAAYALGASRWQTIWHHVLPAALPGFMTGVILALSRAIGEAAPLIVLGIPIYLRSVPEGPLDEFTAMPLQIYHWAEQPDEAFRRLAAAGIVVLLGVLLTMNAVAVAIRGWRQRHKSW